MSELKKQTTGQKQAQDALQTAKLARDLRFRTVGQPAANVLELGCANCGHSFHVRKSPENYFFVCPLCRTIGNLPGVLAAQVDRENASEAQKEERKRLLEEIRDFFPPPRVEPPPPPQVRYQST